MNKQLVPKYPLLVCVHWGQASTAHLCKILHITYKFMYKYSILTKKLTSFRCMRLQSSSVEPCTVKVKQPRKLATSKTISQCPGTLKYNDNSILRYKISDLMKARAWAILQMGAHVTYAQSCFSLFCFFQSTA